VALLPQDKRGQTLLMLTVVGGAVAYFTSCGTPVVNLPGVAQLTAARDSLKRELDSLTTQVNAARRDIREGALSQLEARLAEYRAGLDLMRTLVPASAEIPNLLDDITSRAKIRGATVQNFVPQAVESGAPFDTQRARFVVTGTYDQIGEFLADVASLPRIVVPYDLRLERVQSPTADTTLRGANMLQATFLIRTYVKPQVADTTRAAAGAPAQRGGDE
jgi:type IV pilus assembly protein PilO